MLLFNRCLEKGTDLKDSIDGKTKGDPRHLLQALLLVSIHPLVVYSAITSITRNAIANNIFALYIMFQSSVHSRVCIEVRRLMRPSLGLWQLLS